MYPVNVFRYCFLFFIFLGINVQAQVDAELLEKKPFYLKKEGKRSVKKGDYLSAIVYFEKYFTKKPVEKHLDVLLLLANSYRLLNNYDSAKEKYEELIEKAPERYYLAYYYLALMQIRKMQYAEAKSNLDYFKRNYDKKDAPRYKKKIKLLKISCDSAQSILDSKNLLSIHPLDTSINKAHMELSPYYLEDSILLFSSLRSDTATYFNYGDTVKRSVRKFYTAKKREDGWVFDKEYKGPWNDDWSHSGNGTYNIDSTKFYFTRCEYNSRGKIICKIYQTEKENDEWSIPVALPETINHPKHNSSQPTVGFGLRYKSDVLYFISDQPKSKGGKDIWYSEFNPKKKQWKKAKNLGSKINTVFDEITPYYDNENKILYFSSQGWPGLGGQDVFRSVGELKTWNTPKNIGSPINSSMDELYYIESRSGHEGFFASNRNTGDKLKDGACCDDLYEFKEIKIINLAITGFVYKILVSSAGQDSIVPYSDGEISIYALRDSSNETILIKKIKPNRDGSYFFKLKKDVEYGFDAEGENALSDIFYCHTKNKTESDTIIKHFNLYEISKKPILLKNIYYKFDRADLTEGSKTTIDTTLLTILHSNPNIIIEISSHTDSKGNDEYNKHLSQRRAESVIRYLLGKGIDQERIRANGYGESSPIAPNQNKDGSDNPKGRAINRRTEFKVVGKIKGVSNIIYKR